MANNWNLKFVWPKDGVKGREYRGFFGRLNNILTGRGPDIFLARRNSNTPIKVDHWSNWDSYHDMNDHRMEISNPFRNASRGYMRYDPQTRRYKNWYLPHDWNGLHLGPNNEPLYPRFTEEEGRRMLRGLNRGRQIDPLRMGKEWNYQGPRRFEGGHNWFWQDAHRGGENMRQGLPKNGPVNPNLLMHQNRPDDLAEWINREL